MIEFASALVTIAGVLMGAAALPKSAARKWLWSACALLVACGLVLYGIGELGKSSTAASPNRKAPGVTKPATKSPAPNQAPTTPGPTEQAQASEYLSDAYPVDQDPKADTADVEEGGYEADGIYYDHAIKMNAGCENGDGGDMWADWNLDRKWSHLTGTVALEDDANSSSTITYAVYLDGRKAGKGGTLKIGQSATINLNVSGVYRVRLWMNDPDAPTNDCGTGPFPVPNFIWGNLTATS